MKSNVVRLSDYFLFDFDGTIVDSEKLHRVAFEQVCERENLICDFSLIFGLDTQSAFRKILAKNGKSHCSHLIQSLVSQKRECYTSQVEHLTLIPGVLEFLNYWRDKKQFAICSNSAGASIRMVLEKLGLVDYFELVLSFESVGSPKPNPEMYLRAIKHFSARPENCLVFEDSISGIKAAKAAGCRVVDVSRISFDEMLGW